MLTRRTALAALASLPALACSKGQPGDLALTLDWFPEAEHGGFIAADVHGEYAAEALAVTILPGRPDAPVLPQVAAGRSAFGIADAATVLTARAQQVPVVAVYAAMQHSPRCILVHDPGPTALAGLAGHTVAMNAREPFTRFLERSPGLADLTVVPYAGSVAPFLADPKLAQQAYVFSEPVVVARQGVPARCLMLSELGWDPYAGVLVTSEAMIQDHPERVRRFVAAVARGWTRYLADPAPTHARIHQLNPEMDPDTLARSAAALAPLIADGRMTRDRWQTLDAQLAALDVYPAGATDPTRAFTDQFLPT
jgi:NitT/TauT family transport system substrate-binding protein